MREEYQNALCRSVIDFTMRRRRKACCFPVVRNGARGFWRAGRPKVDEFRRTAAGRLVRFPLLAVSTQWAAPVDAAPFLRTATDTTAQTRMAPSRPKQSAYPMIVAWARMVAPTAITALCMAAAGSEMPCARKYCCSDASRAWVAG